MVLVLHCINIQRIVYMALKILLTPINVSLNVYVKLKSIDVYIKQKLWIIDSTQKPSKNLLDFGTI